MPRKRIAELIAFLARSEGADLTEVDLAIVTGRQIAAINRRYLGHSGATDVLSFDLSDDGGKGISAQLVVCADLAVKEARSRGHGPQQELMLYVVHGLLHLLGYDDADPASAARMGARSGQLLEAFYRRRWR